MSTGAGTVHSLPLAATIGTPADRIAQLSQLRHALQTSQQQQQAQRLTLPPSDVGEHFPLAMKLVDYAARAGAAVTLVDACSSATLFGCLCTGRAPVLSTASAYALEVLSGRRLVQLQLLEGLLRRHARHRPILFVVVDAGKLDSDATWMLHHLPDQLPDAAITWLCFQPMVRAPTNGAAAPKPQSTATVTRLPLRGPAEHARLDASRIRADRARFGWRSLTKTETRVARLIAEGHTNRSAAAELFVSVNTISTHLRSVFSKLDINSRVQLTRMTLECLSADQRSGNDTLPSKAQGVPRVQAKAPSARGMRG